MKGSIVIVGAGPAGLTAALELRRQTSARVYVLDLDSQVGGISKTVTYRGNRMDLGGHRFFSKSDWVMDWWQEILPVHIDSAEQTGIQLTYQQQTRQFVPQQALQAAPERVLLVRPRLSRIFYNRRFFDYPLKLNATTLSNLGWLRAAGIGASYAHSMMFPRKNEVTLEDFFINRFGQRLYQTFFKDYTEKVWGVPCSKISAEWGAQRVKGLSITKALYHALKSTLPGKTDIAQKATETSLIEKFLYPRLGPGQMWETVAERVHELGGEIRLNCRVIGVQREGARITAVDVHDLISNDRYSIPCDQLISTMPVAELTKLLKPEDSQLVEAADRLPYRDFMTAGLIVKREPALRADGAIVSQHMPPDNWIYIQEPDVRLGRLQVFNNWSPDLVADANTVSLGLEYFCQAGDELWSMQDGAFLDFAARELASIGLLDPRTVVDGTVVRVPKAYPAYFGGYSEIGRLRGYLDQFPNLYPIGRNGMHRYNNQDHSMLAAKAAVECIVQHSRNKQGIWNVNAEDEYHEERSNATGLQRSAA